LRSAADAADCAGQARTVSYSTRICADLGVSLTAIFGGTPSQAKPPSGDPKNAPEGKKIHRSEVEISIWNREVNPPIHWSLSFRQKKIHFIPPLTGASVIAFVRAWLTQPDPPKHRASTATEISNRGFI
jgi:hypothetical protein